MEDKTIEESKPTISYDNIPDINENNILEADEELLGILLKDRTTGKNILWMTDNYAKHGAGYEETSEITIPLITGKRNRVIKPRINKSKAEQMHRIRNKAEVFTPSWICNSQNNLVDDAWFGREHVFNTETGQTWTTKEGIIAFPDVAKKTWKDYVLAQRMEISCGEAPYLVSRYDTTTGQMIAVHDRIGLLDRKLRIVTENAYLRDVWITWSKKAVQSIYGYEWQGDSLLLARENLILSYIDHYRNHFGGADPSIELLREIATIVSWNLWQMDGIKFVVPCSCHTDVDFQNELFSEKTEIKVECEGCNRGDIHKHNGIYCMIKDWQKDEILTALSMLRG